MDTCCLLRSKHDTVLVGGASFNLSRVSGALPRKAVPTVHARCMDCYAPLAAVNTTTAPGFGFRGTGDGWAAHLRRLNGEGAFGDRPLAQGWVRHRSRWTKSSSTPWIR